MIWPNVPPVTEVTVADTALRSDAIGLREVLFQSITDMAPGAAIAASIPAGVAFAGGSLPLAVVFALVACLFSAWAIGQLARELPSAGSMATYAARGLHPAAGFLVAWGPAAGTAAAWLHDSRDAQLRLPRLPSQPVVALGDTRPADHRRCRVFRRPYLGQVRHRTRGVRDHRFPDHGRAADPPRGRP